MAESLVVKKSNTAPKLKLHKAKVLFYLLFCVMLNSAAIGDLKFLHHP